MISFHTKKRARLRKTTPLPEHKSLPLTEERTLIRNNKLSYISLF